MNYLKATCPECGQHVEYPAEGAGRFVDCPGCRKVMQLPALSRTFLNHLWDFLSVFLKLGPVLLKLALVAGLLLGVIWLINNDLSGVVMLLAIFAAYVLPSIVANSRNCTHLNGIIILNVLLGWTFLGWVGALIWAVSDSTDTAPAGKTG